METAENECFQAQLTGSEGRSAKYTPDGRRSRIFFLQWPTGIWVWNRKGVHIGTVQMPHGMANLTWGGLDYSKLYITAGNAVYIATRFISCRQRRGILGYLKK
jgi:hypothetical protein